MAQFFRDASLKIERASKHLAELQAAIVAQEGTYIAVIEHNPDTGAESLIHEVPDFEAALCRLSLIAGDAIHNLRSALDFAWYSAISIRLPDKVSPWTKFPVRDTREQVKAVLHGIEVDTRWKALFNFIVSEIQPYKGGYNSAVWTLHDFDISDKHLLLLELAPRGQIRGISVRDANGEIYRNASTLPATGINGVYRVDFEPGIKVEEKGKLSVGITFQEAGIYEPVPVLRLLESFGNLTEHIVRRMEILAACF